MKRKLSTALFIAILFAGCDTSLQTNGKQPSQTVKLSNEDIAALDKEYPFENKALTANYIKKKLNAFIGNDNGVTGAVKLIKELEYAKAKGEAVIPFKAMMAADHGFYTTLTGVIAVINRRAESSPFDLFISEADPNAPEPPTNIIYVNGSLATGNDDGTSWANAYRTALPLQRALNAATDGKNIWVAAGTYKPTDTTNRTISFQLKSGVGVYGGFAGTEIFAEQRTSDPDDYKTILNGDILGDDIENDLNNKKSDNSYHVVVGAANTILEGVTIKHGAANASSGNYYVRGGGMYEVGGTTIKNATFESNLAKNYGAGIYTENATTNLENVTFYNNRTNNSSGTGGGMYSTGSTVVMSKVTFTNNYANSQGGGAFCVSSKCDITDSVFKNNQAVNGGGLNLNSNSAPSVLKNVVFSGNTGNNGSGLYIGSPWNITTFLNTTLYNNNLYLGSYTTAILKNSIVWGSTSPRVVLGDFTFLNIGYSIMEGGFNSIYKSAGYSAGTVKNLDGTVTLDAETFTTTGNNLASDPKFISSDNFALQPDSPAINAGTNDGAPATDITGTARPQGAITDIGAYEFTE